MSGCERGRIIALGLALGLHAAVPALGGAQTYRGGALPDDSAAAARPADSPRPIAGAGVPLDETVAPSPDGAVMLALQTRPRSVIWMLPREGEPFAFREDWSAYLPRWAASGERLGFISAGGPPRVWTVEVEGVTGRAMAPPRMLIRTVVTTFAFAPDGATVALVPRASTAAVASEIVLVDWETRRMRPLVRERGLIYRVDWASDGAIYYGLAPGSAEGDALDRVRRVAASGGRPVTIAEVGQYLGVSADGARLLYRERGDRGLDRSAVHVAAVEGVAAIARIELPHPATPVWSAGADALLQVRSAGAGDEVWEIPIPPPE